MPRKASPLTSSLIARKGEAMPATPASHQVEQPPPPATTAVTAVPSKDMVALSLRLDQDRYERLKIAGVRLRQKSQTILVEALDHWLEKNGY